MARKIASAGLVVASLLAAMPAQAQRPQWTVDRPDGHAPVGVKGDYTLTKGDLYVGYRYYREDFEGTLVGTTPFFAEDILDFFAVAPLTLDREIHELELRFGLTDNVTLMAYMPFVQSAMLSATEEVFFDTDSDDIGDLRVSWLFDLFEVDEYRMLASLGTSVPLGETADRDVTPFSGTGTDVLPFSMQSGSGSWEVTGGLTFLKQNEIGTFGAQANTVLRVADNDRGYRLGDRFDLSFWAAYNTSDWLGLSVRGLFETWGDVQGFEPGTDGVSDPSANPFTQGGQRWWIPFGVSLYFQQGVAVGHRVSFEWYYPVHEGLNGPQLSVAQKIVASWQLVF